MSVSVTFGDSFFGPRFRNCWDSSEYVTFCTISATCRRELTVCVTFGARPVVHALASCGRPIPGHVFDVARGNGFGANVVMTSWWLGYLRRMLPSRAAIRADARQCFSLIAISFFSYHASFALLAVAVTSPRFGLGAAIVLFFCSRQLASPLPSVCVAQRVGHACRGACSVLCWCCHAHRLAEDL